MWNSRTNGVDIIKIQKKVEVELETNEKGRGRGTEDRLKNTSYEVPKCIWQVSKDINR